MLYRRLTGLLFMSIGAGIFLVMVLGSFAYLLALGLICCGSYLLFIC